LEKVVVDGNFVISYIKNLEIGKQRPLSSSRKKGEKEEKAIACLPVYHGIFSLNCVFLGDGDDVREGGGGFDDDAADAVFQRNAPARTSLAPEKAGRGMQPRERFSRPRFSLKR
jgi:hypothetical protein